jgi:hypothetical protein
MRRTLTVGALTLAVLTAGAGPALADPGPRPSPPSQPRGLDRSGVDRPEEAASPQTGRTNRENSPNF